VQGTPVAAVILFKDVNYGGASIGFAVGEHTPLPSLGFPSGTLKSLRVQAGCTATLVRNNGQQLALAQDVPDLAALGFGNSAATLIVACSAGAASFAAAAAAQAPPPDKPLLAAAASLSLAALSTPEQCGGDSVSATNKPVLRWTPPTHTPTTQPPAAPPPPLHPSVLSPSLLAAARPPTCLPSPPAAPQQLDVCTGCGDCPRGGCACMAGTCTCVVSWQLGGR
jgi:hypothetical protein